VTGLPWARGHGKAGTTAFCRSALDAAVTLSLALFQPDIPQNTGTILRLAACLGVPAEIIEPAGFPVSDRAFRRAGMDYLDQVALTRHVSWTAFEADRRARGRRLVLATTRGEVAYTAFAFAPGDTILLGRESAGAPEEVHLAADARIVVPLRRRCARSTSRWRPR
jgi:tRNA (cytidine/uridine-2'-O-)-methyltransferase